MRQHYLQKHGFLARYDLSMAVVIEVDNLLQQQSMPVESVGCVHLCQNVPADCKANRLQLPHLHSKSFSDVDELRCQGDRQTGLAC